MNLLLDTQLILWLANVSRRLPLRARTLIQDPANRIVFSTISIWEVVIKAGLGRSDFTFDAAALRLQLLANEYVELPITSKHVLEVGKLPILHRDPFDRALIAQAHAEGLTLLTTDTTVARYPGAIWQVS